MGGKTMHQKQAQFAVPHNLEREALMCAQTPANSGNSILPALLQFRKSQRAGSSLCYCCTNPAWWWMRRFGGILVAVAAVTLSLKWEPLFTSLLNNTLVLSHNSRTYSEWVAPEQPIYFEVFMFNWTNPERFPNEKPKFEQIGPYRYREIRKHVNVTIFEHNATVAYMTQRSWIWDPETSNGSLTDTVTTINMVAASAAYKVRNAGFITKWGLGRSFAAFNYQLHVTKTVGEMLFDGYEDPYVLLSKYFAPPGVPRYDRFGWFYNRNNSIDTDGYVEVTSGAGENIVGQILKWNHQDSLPFYDGSCSQLNGTAGEFVRRDLEENSTLTMFVPDLCRTVYMDYVESGEIGGVNYHKFEMLDRVFDKSSVSEENNCFCNGPCKWSGVMNVSACRYDAPAFLSLPHFLHGDPSLLEAVDGMAPDPDKHSFFFALEPVLGVPVNVAGRFQFNVYLETVNYLGLFDNVPTMLFPVFWVQQHVVIADIIFLQLRIVLWVQKWAGVVLAVFALVVMLTVVVSCRRYPKYISRPCMSE